MNLNPVPVTLALTWGTIVGLDLVSVPQGLLSRPLVAGAVGGLIAGDLSAGLVAGALLELFALETMPIGASRYPDFGVASVAAAYLAASTEPLLQPAIAGLVGIPAALLGGWSVHALRRRNAVSVQRRLERVAQGESRAIWELQRNGFMRDAVRSLCLIVAAMILALGISMVPLAELPRGVWLSWAAIAGGVTAALSGASRTAGAGARRHWLVAGLATGLLVVYWT